MDRYDVVVVGAGLGGLVAAALLAGAGRKTLLLERNSSVGGAASTYKVGDLIVEAALHQTGDPRHSGDPKHAVLARLGLIDALEWVPAEAMFEVRGGPVGDPFALPSGFAPAQAALCARFPLARAGIGRVLADIAARSHRPDMADAAAAQPFAPGLSLADVFAQTLGDHEGVKAALAANLAYIHDDPATLSWDVWARAQGALIAGGPCFVKGGSQRLSNALRRSFQNAGGRVLLKRRVTEIRPGASGAPHVVVHVREDDIQAVEAKAIVGNAAPHALGEVLPRQVREAFFAAYAAQPLSTSLWAATLGLSEPPARFGLHAYTSVLLPPWMTRFGEFSRAAELVPTLPEGDAPPLTIANYAALDAGLGGPPYLVSVIGPDRLANWSGLDRDAAHAQRARVLDAIVALLDREYPGIAAAVAAKTLNTARSMASYLNAPDGAVYGFAPRPDAVRTPDTAIPGLFLASAYAGNGGFSGAIAGGAAAADRVLAL